MYLIHELLYLSDTDWQGAVRSVQFSPDNLKLVTGSDDKTVKVRPLPAG